MNNCAVTKNCTKGSHEGVAVSIGIAILGLIFLRPHPEGLLPTSAVYIGDIALVGTLALALLIVGVSKSVSVPSYGLDWIVVTAGVLALLIAIVGAAGFKDDRVGEIVKIGYYSAVLFTMLILCRRQPAMLSVFQDRAMAGVFVLVAIVALTQYYEPVVLVDVVHGIWGTVKLRPEGALEPRIYGTFFNANWFGIILALFIIYFLDGAFEGGQLGWNIGLTLLGLMLLILSGSRSGLGAMVCGLTVLLAGTIGWSKHSARRKGVIACGMVVGLSVAIWVGPRVVEYWSRFEELYVYLAGAEVEAPESLSVRVELWSEYLREIARRPLVGPGLTIRGTTPHNSFLAAASGFGVVGGLAALGLVTGQVAMARRIGGVDGGVGVIMPYVTVVGVGMLFSEMVFTTQLMLGFFVIIISVSRRSRDGA